MRLRASFLLKYGRQKVLEVFQELRLDRPASQLQSQGKLGVWNSDRRSIFSDDNRILRSVHHNTSFWMDVVADLQ